MAYTNFVGYMDPTPQEFKTKDWVYKYSLQMFQNGLTGNCYGIASSVAAIAKELGYEPYVITIPEGHSFVMINGLYYDNREHLRICDDQLRWSGKSLQCSRIPVSSYTLK